MTATTTEMAEVARYLLVGRVTTAQWTQSHCALLINPPSFRNCEPNHRAQQLKMVVQWEVFLSHANLDTPNEKLEKAFLVSGFKRTGVKRQKEQLGRQHQLAKPPANQNRVQHRSINISKTFRETLLLVRNSTIQPDYALRSAEECHVKTDSKAAATILRTKTRHMERKEPKCSAGNIQNSSQHGTPLQPPTVVKMMLPDLSFFLSSDKGWTSIVPLSTGNLSMSSAPLFLRYGRLTCTSMCAAVLRVAA